MADVLGNQQLVDLLQFFDEQTIESICQLNSVAVDEARLATPSSLFRTAKNARGRFSLSDRPWCSRNKRTRRHQLWESFTVERELGVARWGLVAANGGLPADNDRLDAERDLRSPPTSALRISE